MNANRYREGARATVVHRGNKDDQSWGLPDHRVFLPNASHWGCTMEQRQVGTCLDHLTASPTNRQPPQAMRAATPQYRMASYRPMNPALVLKLSLRYADYHGEEEAPEPVLSVQKMDGSRYLDRL